MVVGDKSIVLLHHCAPVGPFVPRPFPPPALENVPLPYILDQLHNLAVHYWDRPETADCTIIVPIVPRNSTHCTSPTAALPLLPHDPAGLGRRATEPAVPVTRVTRMTSKLHLDYLLAQSSLFRGLFSGRPPLDPLAPACPDSPNTPPPLPRIVLPPHRLPRLLPSVPMHPVVQLPLPDPASFPHLVHFMYFGTFTALEAALDRGQVRWADVVRNVEYLGMRTRVKSFLGRWYTRHAGVGPGGACPLPVVCAEDDNDGYCTFGSDVDVDSNDDDDDSSSYDSDYDNDSECCMEDTVGTLESLVEDRSANEPVATDGQEKEASAMTDECEPPRGRTRTRESLSARSLSLARRRRI